MLDSINNIFIVTTPIKIHRRIHKYQSKQDNSTSYNDNNELQFSSTIYTISSNGTQQLECREILITDKAW
jgi:hypothetical protein